MGRTLSDGSVVPSFLGVKNTSKGVHLKNLYNNVCLRVGEVRDIIYPDDERSLSKQFLEYTVQVYQKTNGDPGTSTFYSNCLVSNLFGGGADNFTYTLRATKKYTNNETGLGNGSKVLLLCIDGETINAIIVSGILTKEFNDQQSEDDGHNLKLNFNGIAVQVNDDGELTVTFNGATDNDGKVIDDSGQGSTLSLTKDGSIVLAHDDESIKIDHQNNQININSSSNTTIKSSGLLVGDATDNMMLGSTYREAQSTLNSTLIGALSSFSTYLGIFAGQMTALAAGGVTPVTSAQVAAIGATMEPALLAINQAVQAIQQFEAKASTYLSDKNLSD